MRKTKNNDVYLAMRMLRPYSDNEGFDYIYHNDNAICCYVALRILYNENPWHILTFTIKDLLGSLGFDVTERLERQAKKIKNGLDLLQDFDYISYEKKGNYYTIEDTTNIHIDNNSGFWFKIPLENIYKLTKYSNCFSLIHTYVTLVSTININTRVGCTSQIRMTEYVFDFENSDDVEKDIKKKRRNIENYYKTFEDEHIIYFSKQLLYNKPKAYSLDEQVINDINNKKFINFD